jgi:hypothetical protein
VVFVDKLPSRAGYGKLAIEEGSARWEMWWVKVGCCRGLCGVATPGSNGCKTHKET